MRLGFLTACMPQAPLADIAAWAQGAGYEALEVAAWPRIGDRDFTASHLDAAGLDGAGADELRALFDRHGLELSSLAYYDNNLHPDPAGAEGDQRPLSQRASRRRRCSAAPSVGTFVGRDPSRTVAENLAEAEGVFKPLVDLAGERGVALIIENCPMEGWHPDGYPGNLAYSPELWEWMFSLGLLLNFDPSHLLWLGIDPVAALRPYVDRVAHAHAKDAEIVPRPARPLRLLRQDRRARPTAGTRAGGATACPASARSTGRVSSTRSTRAASTASSRSSTRIPCGAATRIG